MLILAVKVRPEQGWVVVRCGPHKMRVSAKRHANSSQLTLIFDAPDEFRILREEVALGAEAQR